MSHSAALIDRVVAEVLRRLPAEGGDGCATIDLSTERVLTGELLEERCEPGAGVLVSPNAVHTPTARDAVRRLGLTLHTASESPSAAVGRPLLVVTTSKLTDGVPFAGWKPATVSRDNAVEQARSMICRGGADFVVVIDSHVHWTTARLNRQAGVFAAGVWPDRAESAVGCNVACVCPKAGWSAFTLTRALDKLAAGSPGRTDS